MALRALRAIKTGDWPLPRNPKPHSILSLPPFSRCAVQPGARGSRWSRRRRRRGDGAAGASFGWLASSSQPSTTDRASSDHGAVAGPLAGTRAPQRVSTPPSSGLATTPPCRARRASSLARLPFPRRRKGRLGSSSPAPAKVGSFPFSLLPHPFSLLGLTRGGDGVKIRVRVSLLIRFGRFGFLFLFVHPNGFPFGFRVRPLSVIWISLFSEHRSL
jgi:hypothetical protein